MRLAAATAFYSAKIWGGGICSTCPSLPIPPSLLSIQHNLAICTIFAFYGKTFFNYRLKFKLFGVLLSIDNVVSVRRLFTETMMSIDNDTQNGLSLTFQGIEISVHDIFQFMCIETIYLKSLFKLDSNYLC